MKKVFFSLSFLGLLLTSGGVNSAYAGWCYYYGCCSPETQQSTITATQRVLSEAAQAPEFASAVQFKEFVRNSANIANTDARLHTYFAAVGVDSNDATAVAEFMGARDHSRYVANAERNLSLTQAQADTLVARMTSEMLSLISGSR